MRPHYQSELTNPDLFETKDFLIVGGRTFHSRYRQSQYIHGVVAESQRAVESYVPSVLDLDVANRSITVQISSWKPKENSRIAFQHELIAWTIRAAIEVEVSRLNP